MTEEYAISLDRMNAIQHADNDKWGLVLVEELPPLRLYLCRVIYGAFSYSVMPKSDQYRVMLENRAIDLGAGYQTPSSAARQYLDAMYAGRRKRATGKQADEIFRTRSHPLFYYPAKIDRGVYVDLKSAYWQIMCNVGWNVDYFPGKWLSPGRAPLDFPLPLHKVARNCLVSLGLQRKIAIWTGKTIIYKATWNKYINYMLWACVMDILHSVAMEALTFGAMYVHTDGYILPHSTAWDFIEYLDEAWGIKSSIKAEGETWVLGTGNYRVGHLKVENPNEGFQPAPFSNLRVIDWSEWLRVRYKKLTVNKLAHTLYKDSPNGV